MKEKSGCSGVLFILAGIGSFICAYIAHRVRKVQNHLV